MKFHIENFHRDQEKEENRKKDLEISQKQKQRSHNSDICKEMIDLIIDISDKAYEYQQINDVEEKLDKKIENVEDSIESKKEMETDLDIDKEDYDPFKISEEDKEMVKLIEKELNEENEDKTTNTKYKPTSTIKLDDLADDDKFFDDFFDD